MASFLDILVERRSIGTPWQAVKGACVPGTAKNLRGENSMPGIAEAEGEKIGKASQSRSLQASVMVHGTL
jgi:hypothetical protein